VQHKVRLAQKKFACGVLIVGVPVHCFILEGDVWGKGHEHDLQKSLETAKDNETIMAADNWEVKGTWKEKCVLLHRSYVCASSETGSLVVARAVLHPFLSCIIQYSGCSCCVACPPFAASATIYVDPRVLLEWCHKE